MQPAGIYVHVPFCARVCPYCDFAVVAGAPAPRAQYLRAVLREIAELRPIAPSFDTLYFGGGTPSWLSADELRQLNDAIRRQFPMAADTWTSLEANPEDVTEGALEAWRRLGISTISLGVQSFDDSALEFLGRLHRGAQAAECVVAARRAGFPVVSVDLMFGLPEQTPTGWLRELERAVQLGPDHLSCYQLTIHEHTPFARREAHGKLVQLSEPAQAELYARGVDLLAAAGYEQYEVSNFSRRPDARSRHNQKYWCHAGYQGIGPAAHSYDGRQTRWWNHRQLSDYAAALDRGDGAVETHEHLSAQELALEAVMLGIRTTDGIDLDALRTTTGVDVASANADLLRELQAEGWASMQGALVRPTAAGLALADHLARRFELPLPDDS